MPPKATRPKNTGNNTRQSRGARSTMSKANANQPKITDLGAATSKKGAVRKTRREGGIGSMMNLDKKPKEASPSSSPRVVGSKASL